MHLSPLTAIIVILIVPLIGTAVFFRSNYLIKHRIPRLIMIPAIYIGLIAIQIGAGSYFGLFENTRQTSIRYELNIKDWEIHPEVQKVRALYKETKLQIANKQFLSLSRTYDVDSPACTASYPLKSETLASDLEKRPRFYMVEQVVSHRELLTIERYYDHNGILRFVYLDRGDSKVRIYLDDAGKIFWAVEQRNNEFSLYELLEESWEISPNRAMEALHAFQEPPACPEIRPSQHRTH